MKPKAKTDLIQHLRMPNWDSLLKYTNYARVEHFYETLIYGHYGAGIWIA